MSAGLRRASGVGQSAPSRLERYLAEPAQEASGASPPKGLTCNSASPERSLFRLAEPVLGAASPGLGLPDQRHIQADVDPSPGAIRGDRPAAEIEREGEAGAIAER